MIYESLSVHSLLLIDNVNELFKMKLTYFPGMLLDRSEIAREKGRYGHAGRAINIQRPRVMGCPGSDELIHGALQEDEPRRRMGEIASPSPTSCYNLESQAASPFETIHPRATSLTSNFSFSENGAYSSLETRDSPLQHY